MRRFVLTMCCLLAAIGCAIATTSTTEGMAVRPACKPANEDDTVYLELLRKVATSPEPGHTSWRAALGLPAGLRPSDIRIVQSSARCERARIAYDSVLGKSDPGRVLSVLAVKDMTAAVDTSLIVEGWHLLMVFSPRWALLGESNWP